MTVLAPGETIGILGGGQLARMLAMAAAQLGLKAHIFAPEADSPAFEVAAAHTIGDYTDKAALTVFAAAVEVVTYEFENVPAETIAILDPLVPVRPNRKALETTQDRLVEKLFIRGIGLATAPFASVEDAGGLARAVAQLGRPSILKTRRFGYDGKGQATVREGSDLAVVFRSLGQKSILEGVVPFVREVSVVAARGLSGQFRAFDVCENAHQHGILSTTRVPAAIGAETEAEAIRMARALVDALDYVGVLAVELFVVPVAGQSGVETLVVNEIAPRVHNSGHWTLGGAVTSQFEQHIRAISGWPLGSTQRYGRILMSNLIGDEADAWLEVLSDDGASLHLYGKAEARPGRKMGHVTRVYPESV
ncbi:5-(carboxyamino)imidazole ribonucleotide synthase [Lichenihabitans psoromatis]|uniref:5-(carboxyamino)imidazole ribonucleotide synthase n=1 Tax=Lichenihabitans psoromatis TaxID=2528642 RepID=UPI0010383127|nr:5-(carboxyamino)imidazole ribonucleotide synthase [Lichenihabitans psoromatis]